MRLPRALFFNLVIFLVCAGTPAFGVIHVPGDAPTIQQGIDMASPPDTVLVAADIYPEHINLRPGVCVFGENPHTTIIDSRLGADVSVPHSYLLECAVGDRCNVGPFAYLRPRADLAEGAKAGTFVEIKNSTIGAGSKVPHLSYLGDA